MVQQTSKINNNTTKLDYGNRHMEGITVYEHPPKTFPCGVCGKCFSSDDRLNIHLHFHTGDKSFSCKICRKRFPKMTELLSHTKDHRTEKPIKCRTQSRRGVKRRRVAMQYM